MTTYARRAAPVRTLVDAQRHRIGAGDTILCAPNDVVWFRVNQGLVGSLGPGHHTLTGEGIPPFLREYAGGCDFHLYFVSSEPVRFRRALLAFAYERVLHVVAELPFVIDVDLEIPAFDRLFIVAAGMLDVNMLDFVVDNETGLVTKKAIEDVAWGLTGAEMLALGGSERLTRVREKIVEWWDRYALRAARFELQVGSQGELGHAVRNLVEEEPAEIGFGKRAILVDEDGTRRAGVISDVEGKRVQMNWDDGSTSWVGSLRLKKPAAARVEAAPVSVPLPASRPAPSGRRVYALSSDGAWRPATALSMQNGWWDVQIDYGPRLWLGPAQLRF